MKQKGKFTASEVKRAISAVLAAGLNVFGVTISVDGGIRIETAANNGNAMSEGEGSLFVSWKTKRSSGIDT